jgi:hypothetical protein
LCLIAVPLSPGKTSFPAQSYDDDDDDDDDDYDNNSIQFKSINLCEKLNSQEANYKVSTGKKMRRVRRNR